LPIAAVRAEAERLYAASNVLEAAFADESGLGAALYWFARQRGWPDASPDEILAEAQAAADESAKLRWSFKDPESKLDLKDRDYQWLGRLVFPALADQSPEPNHVKDTVDQMVGMVRTFAATFVKLKSGKTVRVEPTARDPSLAQLGLHGFMNVPPAVVAALSGHEGGNLRWLGGLPGTTRDYMHFELLERPPLF
jgi:hypothetical protein